MVLQKVQFTSNVDYRRRRELEDEFKGGKSGRAVLELVGDGRPAYLGLFSRGVLYAAAAAARFDDGKRPFFLDTFSYAVDKADGEVSGERVGGTPVDYLRDWDKCLFFDEDATDYDRIGKIDIALARRLVNAQDKDADRRSSPHNVVQNGSGRVPRQVGPFSIDNARFIVADPFRILTIPDIFRQEYEQGGNVSLNDLGEDVKEFVNGHSEDIGTLRLGRNRGYVVVDSGDTMGALGVCVSLKSSERDTQYVSGGAVLSGDAIKILSDRKIVVVGNDPRVSEKIAAASSRSRDPPVFL